MNDIIINNFTISDNSKCFIIAELSANHNQDKSVAIATIKAAKKAGADAIKLQTYTADTITLDCDNDYFKIKGTIWDGRTLYDLYQEAYTPWEWHQELFDVAKEEGIICFSSPFDKTAVDLLENLNTPAYKIASFEITDIPLIEYTASKGKPIIISTGIADYEDIQLAVDTCKSAGNHQIILLKCTSAYPAKIEDANLSMIPSLRSEFNTFTGLSDHTLGITVPQASVMLGTKVIEKHFILNKELGGPDASFSLDPSEFSEMVKAVRAAESAIGKVDYSLTDKAIKSREFSRSLFAVKEIKKGEKLTPDNIKSIRPGFGLHPKHYEKALGKLASKDITIGEPLSFDLICDFT